MTRLNLKPVYRQIGLINMLQISKNLIQFQINDIFDSNTMN